MTKLITLLIGCSFAFAATGHAEEQQKKKKPVQKQPQQHVAPKPHVAPQQHVAPKQHVAPQQHAPNQQRPVTTHHVQTPNNTQFQNNNLKKQQQHHVPSTVQTNKLPAVQSNNIPPVKNNKSPHVQNNQFPAGPNNKSPGVQTNKLPAAQIDRNTVQRIQTQHANFRARPSVNVTSVQYNQNYRIRGSENWHGQYYNAFRSYRPTWHERSWWHQHHNRIVLIGGGWYFWNLGYWYPAWGYDVNAAYYPYDGPIYVGASARSADQVIADAQAILQEQNYYQGEVDGLLGPLTRDALAAYQRDQGLVQTAAIDEPTLAALGLG